MKLVVGLGNPGPRYAGTRHNVGFDVVARLAGRHALPLEAERFQGRYGSGEVAGVETGLLLPTTFMNRSGGAVREAVASLGLDPGQDLLVVYDDLDLPFPRLRMRRFGGSGGHRGMADIVAELGHGDFPRLRFGIGRPADGQDTIDWVLSPFTPEERAGLDTALDSAAQGVARFLAEGVEMAMNAINSLPSAPHASEEDAPR